jgi:hypothetical protein
MPRDINVDVPDETNSLPGMFVRMKFAAEKEKGGSVGNSLP